jgi:hypothetical protein
MPLRAACTTDHRSSVTALSWQDATLMQATLTGMACYMSVAVLHYCLAKRQLSIHSSCSWVDQLAEVGCAHSCCPLLCLLPSQHQLGTLASFV